MKRLLLIATIALFVGGLSACQQDTSKTNGTGTTTTQPTQQDQSTDQNQMKDHGGTGTQDSGTTDSSTDQSSDSNGY